MRIWQFLVVLLALAGCGSTLTEAPYAVGSMTVFVHDETRPFDALAGVQEGVRTLITEIWYPVNREDLGPESRRATYADYVFGDRAVHDTMMTATTFFHLTPDTTREGVGPKKIDDAIQSLFERQRMSYVDAPIARLGAPWPVLVMSHGDAGSRYNMESACEHLAAHGYVVIAPEHTGNSAYAQIGRDPLLTDDNPPATFVEHRDLVDRITDHHGVYGRRAQYGQSYSPLTTSDVDPLTAIEKLDAALVERVNDLRAALRWLDGENAQGPWKDVLALDRVGALGRSFGGATVLAALGLEARFVAGFAVVPPPFPDQRGLLPAEMLVGDRDSVILSRGGGYPLLELTRPTLLFSAAEDALIIGLGADGAKTTGTENPTPDNPHPILRSAFLSSGQPAVWALLANANHASLATSGPYWWPELKPSELPRTFEPSTTYTLVNAETAHLIQKELALDFFDLFVKGDEAARNRMKHGPYGNGGLELETRNF